MKQKIYCVLGMHRSGTSIIARSLPVFGISLAAPYIPEDENNPTGYWEDKDIVQLNQQLLEALDLSWDGLRLLHDTDFHTPKVRSLLLEGVQLIRSRLGNSSSAWGFKDPRTIRVLPFWLEIFACVGVEPVFLLPIRHPANVARSIALRDGLSPTHAGMLWLVHTLPNLSLLRGHLHHFLFYEDLLDRPKEVMADLEQFFELPRISARENEYLSLLSRGLRHHHGEETDFAQNWFHPLISETCQILQSPEAPNFWEVVSALQAKLQELVPLLLDFDQVSSSQAQKSSFLEQEKTQLSNQLDWWQQEKSKTDAYCIRLEQENTAITAQCSRLEQEKAELTATLNYMRWTLSWRLTRPLRLRGWLAQRKEQRRDRPIKPKDKPAQGVRTAPIPALPFKQMSFPQHLRSNSGPRILIVSPDLVGPIRNGGIGTANTALALALAAQGFQVDILYTLGAYVETGEEIEVWINRYQEAGVRLIPLPAKVSPVRIDAPHYPVQSWRVYQWLKQHEQDYDICLAPEWRADMYYTLLARDTGVFCPRWPVIIVTHSPSLWAAEGNFQLPQSLDEVLLDFMERRVIASADVLVSPSAYLLDWQKQRCWRQPDRTEVIANLLIPGFSVGEERTRASQRQIHEVVFFGRLETRKGLELFLRALKRIPASSLAKLSRVTFLGKRPGMGQDAVLTEMEHSLHELEIPHQILDQLDTHAALSYLAEKDDRLAIIPSLMENSPYTVRECLAYQLPFLASKVGGIPELIAEEDRDKILFTTTPAALAKAMTNAIEDGTIIPRPAPALEIALTQWQQLLSQLRERPVIRKPKVQETPLVSVCLVHHERPELLEQAIASLQRQDYPNFEVILVDDGSLSAEAQTYLHHLEDVFQQNNWTIIRQENAFLGAARNRAAQNARGEWLLFMDDDNIAKKNEISTFVHAALHSGADILTCFSDVFTGKETPTVSSAYWAPLGGDLGGGIFRNVYGDANALIRKSVFVALGGFTEDYGMGHEDWEFFHRAVQEGYYLELVPEALFWYRVQKDGMLRSGSVKRNHARNIRPTLSMPGIGTALAYASHLHIRGNGSGFDTHSDSPQNSSLKMYEILKLVLLKRHRFRQYYREYGWRVAVSKALSVLLRS